MKTIIIYTHNGHILKFENILLFNKRSNTLYFKNTGNQGDEAEHYFDNIAGYTVYTKEDK